MYPGPNEWFTAEFVSLTKWCMFSREIMHFTEEEIEDANQSIIYHRSTDSMGTVSQVHNLADEIRQQLL